MADRNVLSEEEIDALLTGVDRGDVETEDDPPESNADIRQYDLTSQDRIVRGRLPTLELIGEKFARQFRVDLQALLRFQVDVGAGGVQVLKFSEYTQSLFVPTSIGLARITPFIGACLLVLDAKLIYRLVERLFGGAAQIVDIDGRDFTPTERRVIDRLHELLGRVYRQAWTDVLDINVEVVGREINPNLLNQFNADDVLMVSTFRLSMEEGSGELHIAIPYAALEPFKSILDSRARIDGEEIDNEWSHQLEYRLLDTAVPVNCEIASRQLRLRDLLGMQVGDVIKLDKPELHEVQVGTRSIFYGRLGESRGKLALEYLEDIPR
ncbi:MAG: flagellar motor switch protein FliM [Pseudomonadales bacterium]